MLFGEAVVTCGWALQCYIKVSRAAWISKSGKVERGDTGLDGHGGGGRENPGDKR